LFFFFTTLIDPYSSLINNGLYPDNLFNSTVFNNKLTINPIETLNVIPDSQPSSSVQNHSMDTIPFNIYNDGSIEINIKFIKNTLKICNN